MYKAKSVDPVRSNKLSNGVDDYIETSPKETQETLRELRALIKSIAPKAEEIISYGMPGYKLNGPLVYFAAFKNHVSLFPTASDVTTAVPELAKYKTGKGTLQFPLDQKLPLSYIRKAVEIRLKENLAKEKNYGK